MPAQQYDMLVFHQLKDLLLAKNLALGGKIDAARLVLGVERLDGAADGLRHHDHARAASKGIIVAFQMLVLRMIAQIHDLKFYLAFPLRPAEDGRGECRKHLGEQRQYGDLHNHSFPPVMQTWAAH